MIQKVWVLAIVGGSGSGKTTLAQKIQNQLEPKNCLILAQDSYYFDQSKNFDFDGGSVNFDHPDALDFEMMLLHIQKLKMGQDIQVPVYDFGTHKRLQRTERLSPCRIVLVDGTLLLSQAGLVSCFDESIFLVVDEETRFQRRLKRDCEQRGRQAQGVRDQFYNQVKIMHDQFVEPSKSFATILIEEMAPRIQKESDSEFQQELFKILKSS